MPAPTTASRARGRRPAVAAARALTTAACLVLFVRVVAGGADGLLAALTTLWQQRPATIAALLALMSVWIWALAQVQRASARSLGADLAHRAAFRISRGAFTLSRVVPGGGAAGGVFAIRELMRLGHAPGLAGGTALVSWAATAVAFAAWVTVAASIALSAGMLPFAAVVTALMVLGTLAVAGLLVLWAVRSGHVRARLVRVLQPRVRDRPGRAMTLLMRTRRQAAGAVQDLDHDAATGSLAAAIGWAASAYLCDLAILAAVFWAVGEPVSPGLVAAGFLSAGVINTIPEVTPGWIGVYEAAMAATYTALGVPAETAVVVTLLHRLVSFWLPVAVGIIPALRSLAAGGRRAAPTVARPPQGRHRDPGPRSRRAGVEVAA